LNISETRRQRLRETWKGRGMVGPPSEKALAGRRAAGRAADCTGTGARGPHCGMVVCRTHWAALLGALILLFPARLVQGYVCCFHGAGACHGPVPLAFALVSVPWAVKDSLGFKAGRKKECAIQGTVTFLSGLPLRRSLDSNRVCM